MHSVSAVGFRSFYRSRNWMLLCSGIGVPASMIGAAILFKSSHWRTAYGVSLRHTKRCRPRPSASFSLRKTRIFSPTAASMLLLLHGQLIKISAAGSGSAVRLPLRCSSPASSFRQKGARFLQSSAKLETRSGLSGAFQNRLFLNSILTAFRLASKPKALPRQQGIFLPCRFRN